MYQIYYGEKLMKKWIRCSLLIVVLGLFLVGCGKKKTEYEKALSEAPRLSEQEQRFLEENWYGTDWQYYDQRAGEVTQKNYVIDEQYYGGKERHVVIECDLEDYYVDYELFDLDTGASHGIWRDSIELGDDGLTKVYTSSRSIEGVTIPSILVRKTR